jgi:sporulation integral membrane protein YlbJ
VYRSKLKTIFLACVISILAISIISFPKESVDASIRGLNMWWGIVFPSLLPFFIISEMLIGFGVVRFIGVLLEPFMRPIFRVPGVGGFIFAMGMASGYPAGAKLTARLRQEGQLTRIEAERLVSFTNSSNPLFIFGAVSVGFFYNPNLGIILALSHYLGNICVGMLMRFYGKEELIKKKPKVKRSIIRTAFSVLHQTRIKDNRPIGKLLGDAVMSSVHTLLMIGGFIILFSVINKLLYLLGITGFISQFFQLIFSVFHLPGELSIPFISGIFEITLGSQLTSQVTEATLMEQVIITSFILAFSGLSVQAQVASILAQTDIRFQPFFIARFFHGIFAATFAYLLWEPLYPNFCQTKIPANAIPVGLIGENGWMNTTFDILVQTGPVLTILTLTLYIIVFTRRMREK